MRYRDETDLAAYDGARNPNWAVNKRRYIIKSMGRASACSVGPPRAAMRHKVTLRAASSRARRNAGGGADFHPAFPQIMRR